MCLFIDDGLLVCLLVSLFVCLFGLLSLCCLFVCLRCIVCLSANLCFCVFVFLGLLVCFCLSDWFFVGVLSLCCLLVCLSRVALSVRPSVRLSMRSFVCWLACVFVGLPVWLFLCLLGWFRWCVSLFVMCCLSVCRSVYVFVYLCLLTCLCVCVFACSFVYVNVNCVCCLLMCLICFGCRSVCLRM